MSQTLQNQALISKSMNGIITISDGIAVMENGSLTNLENIGTNSFTANELDTNTLDTNILNFPLNGTINYTGGLTINATAGDGIYATGGVFLDNFSIENCQGLTFGQNKTITYDGSLTINSLQGGDIFSGGGYALSGFALDNVGGITMGSLQPVNMTGGSITGVGDFTFGQNSVLTFDAGLTINSTQGGDITSGGGFALSGFALDNVGGITMGSLEPVNMTGGSITDIGDTNYVANAVVQIDSGLTINNINNGAITINANTSIYNNVSIGKAISATYELDVSGNINFSGDLYKNGVIYGGGGGGSQSLSDVLTIGNTASTGIDMATYSITGLGGLTFGQNKTITFDGSLTLVSSGGGDIFSGSGYALSGFAMDNVGGITMASLEPVNMTGGSITGVGDFTFGANSQLSYSQNLNIVSLDGMDITCTANNAGFNGFGFNDTQGISMTLGGQLDMNSGTINNATDINFEAGSSGLLYSQQNLTLEANGGDLILKPTGNIDCQGSSITNLYQITADLYNYKGYINFGRIQTIPGPQVNFTLNFPLPQIVNVLGSSGTCNIYLPDLDGLSLDQGSVITIVRAFNTRSVILNGYSATQQIRKMDNTLSQTFTFDNTINNACSFFYNKTQGVLRWVQITALETTDVGSIYAQNTFTAKNIFTADLDVISSKAYMENLTFSNVSTDITITNWDASIPAVPTNNTYQQLYTGTGVYTGTGYETSLVSGTGYTLYIQRGYTFAFYNSNNVPVASNQAFILQVAQNAIMKFKTIAYTLQAGTYVFGWYLESQDNGSGGLPIVVSAINDTTNLQIGVSSAPINSATSFPNWVFTTITFNLEVSTNVRFEFVNQPVSYVNGMWVALTGIELTYSGSILITDSITGKDATISGSVALLNNLSVNDGLDVASGGLSVVGGINTTTTYGSSNTTINTTFGSLVGSSNSSLNVAIGDGALQAGTDADKNVVIGTFCNPGATTINNMVCIGYNVVSGVDERQSIIIGSNQMSKGSSVSNNIIIGYKTYPTLAGTARYGCIGIGTDCLGGLRSNNFGALSSDYSVAIGTEAMCQCIDLYNTAIGHRALYVIAGTNNIEDPTDATQYNTALGYQAGSTYIQYNKCSFLGASSDANFNDVVNSTAIGYNSIITSSNQIVLGGNDGAGNFPVVLLPNKNTIYACQNQATNFTLAIGSNENIIITSNAVNAITLPTISLASSIGATFTFKKSYTGGLTSITLTAGATQNIIGNNTTANTYVFTSAKSFLKLTCIATSGNVWAVVEEELSLTEVQNNANIFTAIQRFNQGVRFVPTFVGLTGNVDYSATTSFLGKKIYVVSNNATTNTITLTAVATANGFTLDILNQTNTAFIISSTAIIGGRYGSFTTTMNVYGGATLRMYCNGINWYVDEYSGLQQQIVYRNTTTQLIPQTTITAPTIATTNNICWASRTLTYNAGVWTNSTGFDMTLSVSAYISWNSKANSATIGGAGNNANGIRNFWLLHSNTTSYPKFMAINNYNTFHTSAAGNDQNLFLQTSIQYHALNATFLLKNGENFRLQCNHNNTINVGGTGIYLVSNANVDATNITITRMI